MTKSHKRSPRHLSDTALILLGRAADSENQLILPIPKSVRARGMALGRVLRSLLRQGFVEEVRVGLADEAWRSDDEGRFGLRITSAGLRAIGVPALASGLEVATGDDQPAAKPPRPGSKLAQLITMLMQPVGRTVDELSDALGWQAHTTRAVISRLGKSGHVVVRAKNDAGQSVYRIEPAADACWHAVRLGRRARLGWSGSASRRERAWLGTWLLPKPPRGTASGTQRHSHYSISNNSGYPCTCDT